MKIESIAVDSLKADPANVRTHDARNLESIKGSLAKFGQQKPIVVDGDGIVVAGNGTLQAARILGWAKVDAVRTNLAGADAVAYAIADNRTAELAAWDDNALAKTLAALQCDQTIDEAVTGFDANEIDTLIASISGCDVVEDEAPEPPDEPTTKPGDLILLGEHRLLCGDSTNADDVARLMNGERADVLFTDPPYGMDLETDFSMMPETDCKSNTYKSVEGDSKAFDPMPMLDTFATDRSFVWGGDWFYTRLPEGGSWVVWVKRNPGTEGLVGNHFEVCWTNGRHKRRVIHHHWSGYTAHDPGESRVHPTQKPIAVCVDILNDVDGTVVADPYLGSGTTLIACEKLGRKCYGMEIDPAYCDVIVQRWENLTGKKAKRAKGKSNG